MDNEESELAKKVKTLLNKEEDLLARAVAQTMKRYNDNPTVANLRAWEAAKAAFDTVNAKKAAERCFINLTEVLEYIKTAGWKVEKSKLYADARKIGKQKNGTFAQKDVDEYARLCLPRIDGSSPDDNSMVEKARLDNQILTEKLKAIKLDNEINAGQWLPRSEVEQKHATKLGVLMTAIDNYIASGSIEAAIDLVGGNRDKVAELREHLKKGFRDMLHEYARRPEFAVSRKTVADAEELIIDANG